MHGTPRRSLDFLKSSIFLPTNLEASLPSKSNSDHFPLQVLKKQAFLTPVGHNR